MNEVLEQWNRLELGDAADEILPCCGSQSWAHGMASRRPIADETALLYASDKVWNGITEADWMEAFRSHPRIGEASSPASGTVQSAAWSGQEQRNVAVAEADVKTALAEGNRAYEQKFQRTFIVCAAGKSATEILGILQRRLQNDEEIELHQAAEEQRQIIQIRLKKWLNP